MLPTPNFDPIARPYRWLEYLTLGRTLERCRNHFLPQLTHCRRALVLGDGDGRFLAQLLVQNVTLEADVVDASAEMLELLLLRCNSVRPNPAMPVTATRISTHHADARTFTPSPNCDLVVTHFFLDCLTQPELCALIARITPTLAPGALWLLSDFRIPNGPLRLPTNLLVCGLYLVFRILTGLRVTHLPDHATQLTAKGFTRLAEHHSLAGLLTTELWQLS